MKVVTIINAMDGFFEKVVGLYRSRVVRLTLTGLALAWLAMQLGVDARLAGVVEPQLIRSLTFKLVFVLIAIVGAHNLLKAFDNSLGVTFKDEFWPRMREGNIAVAIYLGARFVGVCLLLGSVL